MLKYRTKQQVSKDVKILNNINELSKILHRQKSQNAARIKNLCTDQRNAELDEKIKPSHISPKCTLSFSTSISYLSGWRCCPNLKSNARFTEKKRSANRIRDSSNTRLAHYATKPTLSIRNVALSERREKQLIVTKGYTM